MTISLLLALFLSPFFNKFISLVLLILVLLGVSIFTNFIKLNVKKRKKPTKATVNEISILKWEFKKFFIEKTNVIGIISMFLFLNILNYNIESIDGMTVEFGLKYFLILLIISSISPLNLMFSSDKELRKIATYMPVKKRSIFMAKILVSTLISQFFLSIVVFINEMLFQEKLGLLYFKVSILLFFLTFLRLKLDMIKPILDYEDKMELWRNPKKYLSLMIVIPPLFVAVALNFYISLVIILSGCLVLELYSQLYGKEDFFGYK
ncbi:hypothetical protein JL837_07195 [Staphylococcus pseudintermedius]|nr:hypothetical protein [Staphylococcus pseudintermedius]MCE5712776.1 hypothetical protein [Staphylococcus pseudintermedius]MCE5715045.1 hypothetical protein [Staphylococcus pseudintermedius]MCE5736598.1 hypothetical protein [Staphylococcus pseudintermedius]